MVGPNDPARLIQDAELKAAQESKRRRRASLIEAIKKAGINPADIDVTMVASDEDQAKLLQQMADRNEAKEMAEKFGRQELRERLKRTAESCTCGGACSAARNGVYKPSTNGTKPLSADKIEGDDVDERHRFLRPKG